jgi:diadenosine tetraphosphatase ApaH/serine/threonine PP2A family protein phosphatase
LETCLADAETRQCERTLFLGDLIGYGADPNAVVERVRDLQPAVMVRGNHDKVVFGMDQAEGFNAIAKSAAAWMLETLTPHNREWVAALPQGPQAVDDLVEICHGAPYDEDAYIFDEADARLALSISQRPLCLFGHTHYPVTFELADNAFSSIGPTINGEARLELRDGVKYLLNPGSVGQPRDGDPRAAYAIVDTTARQVELFRLMYPVEVTQKKIIEAGLPEILARRLAAGR